VREEIFKQGIVNPTALGMILHSERKRIITQAHLLDDVIGQTPGFDLATVRQSINRLMMRAVHFFETVPSGALVSKRLDIMILHLGKFMTGNVELERAAERDI
jgi:hypothetical protein